MSIPCIVRTASGPDTDTFFLQLLHPAQASSPETVTTAEVDSHILKLTSNPHYPALRQVDKDWRQGQLHITISSSGDDSSVKVISGHPFLIPSAMEAAKKWEHSPFVEDGTADTG